MTTPTPDPADPGCRRRWWLEPAAPAGALFYAVIGGLLVWILVDFIPHHLTVTASLHWH